MIIKINCGGKYFETTDTTLKKSDFFATLLERWNTEETIFLDEDSKYFRIILIYLRDNVIEKNKLDKKLLLTKFKYYLPSLNDNMVKNIFKKKTGSVFHIDETMISNSHNTGGCNTMSTHITEILYSYACDCMRASCICHYDRIDYPEGFQLLISHVKNFYVEPNGGFLEKLVPINLDKIACRYIGNSHQNNKTIIIMRYLTDIIAITDIKIGKTVNVSNKYRITRTSDSYEIRKIE